MLMVVFGAGASHDSLAQHLPGAASHTAQGHLVDRVRLPLAAGLFDERFAEAFSGHQNLLGLFPQLRWAAAGGGVEQELEKLVGEAATDGVLRQQLVGLRFYLQQIIGNTTNRWLNVTQGATHYAILLERIDRWRRRTNEGVALVTFNYDVLLEHAATTLPYFRGGLTTIDAYTARDEYKLLKLHGSTNWWRLVPGAEYQHRDNVDAMAIALEKQLPLDDTFMTEQQKPGSTVRGPVTVPAIAIPIVEKSDFECPARHVAALKSAITETTKLLVIGWRGMEKSFLSLWTSAPSNVDRLVIVDRSDGGRVTENQLRTVAKIDPTHLHHATDGFSAFIHGDQLDVLF